MAGHYAALQQTAAAAAAERGGDSGGGRETPVTGGLHPLLTVRTSSCFGDDAAAAATVGCLCFLSPSLLAAGDTAGCVSFIDLLTRRPLAAFAASASCSSKHLRSNSNVWGLYGSSSSRAARLPWREAQKLRSPLLQMAVIEGCSEASPLFQPAAAAASAAAMGCCTATAAPAAAAAAGELDLAAAAGTTLLLQGSSEERRSAADTEEAEQAVAQEAAAGDAVWGGRQLLLQQKSSVISLWDVDYLTPCCRFSTGAYSFCKFTLLQEPKQQLWQQQQHSHSQQEAKEPHEQQPQQQEEKAVVADDDDDNDGHVGPTHATGAPVRSAGALLLAAPVADAETIGIFDLRCCRQTDSRGAFRSSSSNSSSSFDSARVAQPAALLLKPSAAAVASACATVTGFPAAPAAAAGSGPAVSAWGAMHALAAVPGSTTPHPLLLAAYELPCVALWDLRNNSQPLSTTLLPSTNAAASSAATASSSRPTPPAAPPSCLAVYRNQCWVGSYEGDLWVLQLKQRRRALLPAPVFAVNVVSPAFEASGTASALVAKRKNSKVSYTYNRPQQQLASAANYTPLRCAADPTAASSTACATGACGESNASADVAAASTAALHILGDSESSPGTKSDAGTSTEDFVAAQTPVTSAALVQTPRLQGPLLLRSAAAAAPAVVRPSPPACVLRLPHPDGDTGRQHAILCSAFRPDGAVVGVGAANGVLHLFETKSRRCLGSLRQQGAEVKALAWCSETGVLAATAAAGRIALWGVYLDSYSVTKGAAHRLTPAPCGDVQAEAQHW